MKLNKFLFTWLNELQSRKLNKLYVNFLYSLKFNTTQKTKLFILLFFTRYLIIILNVITNLFISI